MPRKKNSVPLSRLEQTVMARVWDLKEATAADIADALQAEKPLAITTVHTVLNNLCKKGWVERAPRTGRSLLFKPLVTRETAGRRSLREVIANAFGGSPQDAILCLLRDEQLTQEERDDLRRIIASNFSQHEGDAS
ncbi:MAG: BlaI/MecI/CopY family transcriptional regulator [Candidatus Hydrogenedentes bacterium]|nr:BlaI/MecI/CopY family transcriptional regulator [Candidatus Hydrogenedentota bacterium]